MLYYTSAKGENWFFMTKRNRFIIIGSGLILILVFVIIGFIKCSSGRVYDFDPEHDTAGIMQNFKEDWYWLIAEGLQFDVSYMLQTRSPNKNPAYYGKLYIKVIRDIGQTAAFTSYYKLTPETGWIQFVSVNRRFRGKGYGRKLVDYAVKDLLKMGCKEVKLLTRINNLWAQRIYDRYGFVQYKRDDRFVDYVFKKP